MIQDTTEHIGVLLISLHIPQAQSLKDKRMVLKSIKARIRLKFNVSVSELDGQDKWQTATIGIAAIGNDQRLVDSSLQHVLSFVRSFPQCEVCDHNVEFI